MKNGNRRSLLEWFSALAPVAAVIATLAATYVTYRLAPFAANLEQITKRVVAIEDTYVEHNEIDFRLVDVIDRLDRIENKLDRHLER